jgi:hypothetical protein
MGRNMVKDIDIFDRLVSHLNLRWKLHKDLFQGAHQYELFNEAGSNVWLILRESLLDSIFMDISRLLDPKSSCGKDNISVDRLLEGAVSTKYQNVLGKNHAEAINLYKKLILPWRNRRLSHNDLVTLTGQTGLPDVAFAEIDELIGKINEVARFISLCNNNTDRDFVTRTTHKGWTARLFRVLRGGIESLPSEIITN